MRKWCLRCDFSIVYIMHTKAYVMPYTVYYTRLTPYWSVVKWRWKLFILSWAVNATHGTYVSQCRTFFGHIQINIAELFIIIWNEIVCKMVISRRFFLLKLSVAAVAVAVTKPRFRANCDCAHHIAYTYNVRTVQMGKNDTVFFLLSVVFQRKHSTWINSNLNFLFHCSLTRIVCSVLLYTCISVMCAWTQRMLYVFRNAVKAFGQQKRSHIKSILLIHIRIPIKMQWQQHQPGKMEWNAEKKAAQEYLFSRKI